jgi:hypothetical protein
MGQYGYSNIFVKRWNGLVWEEIDGSATGFGISSGFDSLQPSIDISDDGNVFVTWYGYDEENPPQIYVKAWMGDDHWAAVGFGSDSGGGVSNTSSDSYYPTILVSSTDVVYIAWVETPANTYAEPEIFIRKWDSALWEEVSPGSAQGEGLSQCGELSCDSPAMAISPDGKLYITWDTYSLENLPGEGEIRVLRLNETTWEEVGDGSATSGISNTIGHSNSPSIAINSDGVPYIAWGEITSTGNEIFIRRWKGTVWEEIGVDSATRAGVSYRSDNSRFPSLVCSLDDIPIAVWENFDSGDWEIHVRQWLGD